jgi:hypothetical protein
VGEESASEGMTVKAAEAFAAYVGMGPGRNLRALAAILAEQGHYKTATTALGQLARWSSEHRWQERLAAAVTAKTEDALAKAAEIDAQSFLRTSEMIAERLAMTTPMMLDVLVKTRESVRKPEPKGAGASVNVNLTVTLRTIVERLAAERGLDPEDVLAEADEILKAGA